jgi:tRNA(Ile)-lysidine synthase
MSYTSRALSPQKRHQPSKYTNVARSPFYRRKGSAPSADGSTTRPKRTVRSEAEQQVPSAATLIGNVTPQRVLPALSGSLTIALRRQIRQRLAAHNNTVHPQHTSDNTSRQTLSSTDSRTALNLRAQQLRQLLAHQAALEIFANNEGIKPATKATLSPAKPVSEEQDSALRSETTQEEPRNAEQTSTKQLHFNKSAPRGRFYEPPSLPSDEDLERILQVPEELLQQSRQRKHSATPKGSSAESAETPEHRTSSAIRRSEDEERFLAEELSAQDRVDSRTRRERHAKPKPQPVALLPMISIRSMAAWQDHTPPTTLKADGASGKPSQRRSARTLEGKQSPASAKQQQTTLRHEQEREHMLALRLRAMKPEHPEVEQALASVEKFLREYDLCEPHTHIICAVSGGVDSIALLDMLFTLSVRRNLVITVVHCHHQLRGADADADAEFVRKAAKYYGLALYSATANVARYADEQRLSIETAARIMRYNVLEYVAFKTKAHAVATAHTLNDSVETMLANLLRGSGLTGLGGIAPIRAFGVFSSLVRPLLTMQKETLIRYCTLQSLRWREDESNQSRLYMRNRIRHDLIPALQEYAPSALQTLHRTSRLLRNADALIESLVEKSMPALLEDAESYYPTHLALNVQPLRLHPEFLRAEIVHRAVERHFQAQFGAVNLSSEAVERALTLLHADIGAKADLNKHLYALRDRHTIIFAPKWAIYNLHHRIEWDKDYDFGGWRLSVREVPRREVRFTPDPAIEFVNPELVPYRLTVRTWQAGDRFQPLGMKGSMNISDYLTNSKVSFLQRQHALVLTTESDIIWLCGMRMSEKFRLPDTAQTALRLEYRPKKMNTAPTAATQSGTA